MRNENEMGLQEKHFPSITSHQYQPSYQQHQQRQHQNPAGEGKKTGTELNTYKKYV